MVIIKPKTDTDSMDENELWNIIYFNNVIFFRIGFEFSLKIQNINS